MIHRRSSSRTFAFAFSLVLGVGACAPDAAELSSDPLSRNAEAFQSGARTLYTWYSASRGDYYTTTDPAWVGRAGDTRSPDYVFVREEGRVADPAFPEAGTKPLYNWWNASRGDNLLTTNPAWAGRPGDVRDGYVFVRLEGHVYTTPVAGTLPLMSRWNASTQDNYTTADPRVNAAPTPSGYTAPGVEGYLLSPSSPLGAAEADFGFGAYRINGARAAGSRPTLLVMMQFRDETFAVGDTCAVRRARVFGPGYPNVKSYYEEVSGNAFTLTDVGCIGPVTARDIPGTAQDESTHAGAMAPRSRTDTQDEGVAVLNQALAESGFEFWRYDTNTDGILDDNELQIVGIVAGPGAYNAAHNRTLAMASVQSNGRTYYLRNNAAIHGEAASFTMMAHEIGHSIFPFFDLYGSGSNSEGLTLMSDSDGAGLRTWYPDPWNRIRVGWAQPRVLPITNEGNQAELDAPSSRRTDTAAVVDRRPLVLFDPARSLREYFIIEYRNRTVPAGTMHYDFDMHDWRGSVRGVAVWHVMTDDAFNPRLVRGIKILAGDDRVLDSSASGNDLREVANGVITPGVDRVLQSVTSGDDVYADDVAVRVRGVVDAGSAVPSGNPGFSGLLRPEDGDFYLTWSDGSAAFRIRSSAPSSDGARVTVEWSRGTRRMVPRVDSAYSSTRPGVSMDILGAFGAAQSDRIPALRSSSALIPLPVGAWSPTSVRVTVPGTTPAGVYDLVVYNPSYLGVSNALRLTISP